MYDESDAAGQGGGAGAATAGRAGSGGVASAGASAGGGSGAAGSAGQDGAGGQAGGAGASGEAGQGGQPGGGSGGKAGGTTTPPCENKLVFNEIMAVGDAGDEKFELVELLNVGPDACSVSLDGWTIERDGTQVFTGEAVSKIANGKRYVLAGQSYADSHPNDVDRGLGAQSVFPADGGCFVLRKKGKSIDEVCYGAGKAPLPPASKSIGRFPDGADTDDDVADWAILDTPSPRGQN